MWKLKFIRLLFFCLIFIVGLSVIHPRVLAQSAAESLAQEIDDFFAAGAEGYIVWQYSGNKGNSQIFASDPYAFFQGTPDGEAICKVLKEKSAVSGKFVGVNMWDVGGAAHDGTKIAAHFKWLHDSCGVTVVRIFAKAGGPQGVTKALDAANGTGVQLLVAIGDYSNGSPGLPSKVGSGWFKETLDAINARNSSNEFYAHAAGVANEKDHPSFWGVEVANEIHCRGDATIIEDYKNLGAAIARMFPGERVGFGQKASENTTMCDSPGPQHEGQSHFDFTNSDSGINMSSAHYYNPAEKALSLEAAAQAGARGQMFYVGEAPARLNADGTDPTTSINYQTIPYDFDKYYIHPIKGIEPKNKDIIRDDLVRQGYEARCAAPGFDIVLNQAGAEAMRDYLRCGSRGCNSPGGEGGVLGGIGIPGADGSIGPNPLSERVVSLLSVDYREALIPILRDNNRLPQLKRSLEDYFGYKEPATDNYNLAEMRSGAVNSLLTSNQRCVQSAISLLQRQEMCNKLADPSACALYETEVPNTSMTVKALLDQYKSYSSGSIEHQETCTRIVSSPDSEFRRGMLGLPLQVENSYRLAFLVTTIRTRVPLTDSMLNLFQHPHRGELGEAPDPPHVVIVTAFKIPDIVTNKGTIAGEPESGHTDFNDPAMVTRDVLIPSHIKQEMDERGDEARQRLLTAGRYVATVPQDDNSMEIECQIGNVGSQPGVGAQQCKDPLTWALVDLINAQAMVEEENGALTEAQKDELSGAQREQLFTLNCDDEDAFEQADYIYDPAQLDPLDDPGRVFRADWGVTLLENLFTDQTHIVPDSGADSALNPMYSDTNNNKQGGEHWGLKSVFHVVDGNRGAFGNSEPARTVKHFIVYPAGYDLKTVEAVMSGTFFSSNQIADLKEKSMAYQQFEIKDDKVIFTGGEASHTFEDKYDCKEVTKIDGTGTPYTDFECVNKTFGFSFGTDQEPSPAGVLGAKLGYWMYTIQLALQRAQSLTHKYLENCDSTEDFLLDACGGASVAQVGVGANISADFTDISSFQIPYWSGNNVVFNPPSQELWNAITAASQRHGCDPWMVLATAHSESQSYTNHTTPNAVGALGVFQFTPGAWNTWTRGNATGVNQCITHQPPTFTTVGLDFSTPTNIAAAADSACRLLLWTGAQRYYDNESQFIRAFAQRGDNQYGQIWNAHTPQADYVWRLWRKLLETAGKDPVAPPVGYPYPACTDS